LTAYTMTGGAPWGDRNAPWGDKGGRADPHYGADGPRHRGPWMRHGETPDAPQHEHRDHEHHGRGRGHHGGPFGFAAPGPEFGFGGPGFGGPRGPRGRGRGRAGRGDVRSAILVLLAEEPRNGYQIIQEIEQRTDGVWRASSGSVYPALAQLEDEGLIEQVSDGGRKLFTLTAAGRAHGEQNAEQLARIWEDATGGQDSRFDEFLRHRELVGQLVLAYKQVAEVGTAPQREEARAVLTKARQALYKILAAEEPQDSAPPHEV
jgi:DNA-binding PadR family transcriptional regulator